MAALVGGFFIARAMASGFADGLLRPDDPLRRDAALPEDDLTEGDFVDKDFADRDFADRDSADRDLADRGFADGDLTDGDFAGGTLLDGFAAAVLAGMGRHTP